MRSLAVFLSILITGVATGASAQTTDGSIRGYVRDEQGGSLPGVTVTATSTAAPRPHVAVTDGGGLYRLLNLTPGDYTITAEIQGFAKFLRANVVVRAGLNLSVDVEMKIGTLNETIQVVAETPLLESTKAVQAVNVSGEMQEDIPLGAQKHWSEFLRFAPGAISRDATVNQAPVFYVHGAGITSSSTLIDGADMTSAINPWAGYTALPGDTVADVQLKTSGLDASAPLGMGVAANVVTKSGTNRFTGSASVTYSPKEWIGNNVPGGSAESSSLVQPDLALGGPLARDKWWFFGSYRYRSGTFGIGRPADQVADMQALDASFEPFDNEIGANILFTKVTGQLSPSQQFSAFFNRDSSPYDSNGTFNTGRFVRTIIGGKGLSARLNSAWSDRLTSRFVFSWNDKGALTRMVDTSLTSRPVFRTAFLSSGQLVGATQRATLGNVASATESPYAKWTITGDTTLFHTGWIGSHELQAGVFLQPYMTREDLIVHANGGFGIEDHVMRDATNPAAGTIPFRRRIFDTGSGVLAKGHFADDAFYLQDTWRLTDRLTVTGGVRVDHVTRNDDLFTMELQNSWEFGPRFGVNYLLTKDQRNAIRGSYMRVGEAPNINALSASGAGTQGSGAQTIGFRDLYDLNLDGSFETTFTTPAASPVSPTRVLDTDYHQPYVEEWAAGYRRQLPGQASVDVGFINREYKDRTALVEQNAIYAGNVFQGYRNPALNDIFLVTNNQWNWPVYRALEAVFTKQTERFQTVASYTRVWPHLAGTWQPNDPASFIQRDAFEFNRGLGSNDNRGASPNDSLSTTTTPSSIEWTEQVARVSGVYHAPWNISVSGSYTLQKGRWSGPVLTRISAPDSQFGPSTVTLPNGRIVANPLATTLRFAHPTRSDGQFQLPALQYINLRVGKEFPFGDRRLGVNLDVFNVPNRGSFQGLLTGANQLFSTNYGRGGEIQPPRSVQLEVRLFF